MKRYLLLAPALLGLSTVAFADPMTPAEYVATAGASDLYERTASEVVLETSTNPQVKSFAEMMVKDHSKSTAMVKSAAEKSDVMAGPPMLTPAQSQMIAELQAQTGPARDATYIMQQKKAHQMALMVQQSYASDGTAPALRMTAAKIVPVVQHHIEMLNMM